MKNKIILKHLRKLSKHLHYHNNSAPFPPYDSEYVECVDKLIKEIMEDKKQEYDEQPVVACKYCKSLHIKIDEDENDICMRCGSINELKQFSNIYEYNKFLDARENS